MKISIITFSKEGSLLASRLAVALGDEYYLRIYSKYPSDNQTKLEESIFSFTNHAFKDNHILIFIGSIGIATRAIAPCLEDKTRDCGVIVLDEKGLYTIPLVSNHLGQAMNIGKVISDILENTLVMTTSSDVHVKFAVDVFALNNNLKIMNRNDIKLINSAILNDIKINIKSDYLINVDMPSFIDLNNNDIGLYLSDNLNNKPFKQTINLVYKRYIIGIGVRKDKDYLSLATFFKETMLKHQIDLSLIQAITSIDLKKQELALHDLSLNYHIPFYTYTSNQLNEVTNSISSSAFVLQTTNTDNVCERSALYHSYNGQIIYKKETYNGMSIAIIEDTPHISLKEV